MPAAIGVAAQHIGGAEEVRSLGGRGAVFVGRELVRHGGNHSVKIAYQADALHQLVQIGGLDVKRNNQGIAALIQQRLGHTGRRFDLGNGIANDSDDACFAT